MLVVNLLPMPLLAQAVDSAVRSTLLVKLERPVVATGLSLDGFAGVSGGCGGLFGL